MGGNWSSSRFWQYWAIAGMVVLTAAFWWVVENHALFQGVRPKSQIADGVLRFSILVLTPTLLLMWLAAGWMRRRVGEGGYWQLFGLVTMIWVASVLVTRMLS